MTGYAEIDIILYDAYVSLSALWIKLPRTEFDIALPICYSKITVFQRQCSPVAIISQTGQTQFSCHFTFPQTQYIVL